jgi:putative Mn2+ efflux pump MntP
LNPATAVVVTFSLSINAFAVAMQNGATVRRP